MLSSDGHIQRAMFNHVCATKWNAPRRAETGVLPLLHGLRSATLATAIRSRRGVASVEYAMLLVGIVVVVGTSVAVLGNAFSSAMATAGTELIQAQATLRSDGPGTSSRLGIGGASVASGNPLSERFPAAGSDVSNPRVVVHIVGMH